MIMIMSIISVFIIIFFWRLHYDISDMNAPTTMIMIVMSLEETSPKGMRNFVCLFVFYWLLRKKKKESTFYRIWLTDALTKLQYCLLISTSHPLNVLIQLHMEYRLKL